MARIGDERRQLQIERDFMSLAAQLSTVNSRLDALSMRSASTDQALLDRIAAAETMSTSLATRLSAAETGISGLNSAVSTHTTQISALQTASSNYATRITALEADILTRVKFGAGAPGNLVSLGEVTQSYNVLIGLTLGVRDYTFNVAGAALNDRVIAFPKDPLPTGFGVLSAVVPEAGKVRLRFYEPALAIGYTATFKFVLIAFR